MKISKIILYDEPTVPEIDIDGAAEFIKETFGIPVEKRESLFIGNSIYHIASSRISELRTPFERHEPTLDELNFERENKTSNIVYYDGFELQNVSSRLIPKKELTLDVFHIIFTDKLTCTFDDRYHGRAVICSNPSIISTTGIIEAPAKPREYYVKLMTYFKLGINVDKLKEEFRGEFLEYHDSRLAKIIRGYILQTIFYYETQEPFCDVKDCLLYNAHWQKDLLHSQLEIGMLCKKHQDILDNNLNY